MRPTIQAIRPDEVVRPSFGTPGLVLDGKYRLDAPIARGGMARVWRATHVTLNRPVAVKFIDALGATPAERVERFLGEATVAASVRHQNVVDILDFGVVSNAGEDEPYMVMELLEGLSLDDRLAKSSLGPEEAVNIAVQVLNGLEAVHRAGIVHRDLKPGNVFLTDDPFGVFVRVLDFGISKGTTDDRDVGVVIGTPEYMSPEQAYGEPLDVRSDLYSAGVLMYEMLAGHTPFTSPDPAIVVAVVAAGPAPSLSLSRPDLPELCAVVDRAMAHDREDRFDSALTMRRTLLGLRPITEGEARIGGTPDRPISGTRPRLSPIEPTAGGAGPSLSKARGPRVAVALLVLTIAGIVAAEVWRAARPTRPTRASAMDTSVLAPTAPRVEPLVVEPVVDPPGGATADPVAEGSSVPAALEPLPAGIEDAGTRRRHPRPEPEPPRTIVREADF